MVTVSERETTGSLPNHDSAKPAGYDLIHCPDRTIEHATP